MPEVLAVHHLPQMFDAERILADHQLSQVLDSADHRPRMPLQSRFSPAEQPRLVGKHLHKDPIPHAGVANEGFNASDFH